MIETFGHGPELPVPIAYHCMIATILSAFESPLACCHTGVGGATLQYILATMHYTAKAAQHVY